MHIGNLGGLCIVAFCAIIACTEIVGKRVMCCYRCSVIGVYGRMGVLWAMGGMRVLSSVNPTKQIGLIGLRVGRA